MNRRFRLAPVLRARQAQEDLARGAVVQARAETESAAALVKRRQLNLAGAEAPSEGTARAMVAALVARHSLAAGLADASRLAGEADAHSEQRVAELAEAAKRRRGVERLAQRHTTRCAPTTRPSTSAPSTSWRSRRGNGPPPAGWTR